MAGTFNAGSELAARITRTASSQAYYTVRFLADKDRRADACAAYAYFRWVDDWIDKRTRPGPDRVAFIDRQVELVDACYGGDRPRDLLPEEQIVADLIQANPGRNTGLAAYIDNLMAVMAFDASRRGRLIAEDELSAYQSSLAVAVTEAMRYFVGHDQESPMTEARYMAVRAAHITHMLRDTREDVEAGYYNVPAEFLNAHGLRPQEVHSAAYKMWVCSRVEQARGYFRSGLQYIARVRNTRYKLACYAYVARFQILLDMIQRDGYLLRPEYPSRRAPRACLRMAWSLLRSTLSVPQSPSEPAVYSAP